jgi:CBS domain containing-hemolysin-like protein
LEEFLVHYNIDPTHPLFFVSERKELLQRQKLGRVVAPLISNNHRLLVSLLLLNCVCAESLPIVLDGLPGLPSWVAVLLSVVLIVVFGEIIPTAIFANSKNGCAYLLVSV